MVEEIQGDVFKAKEDVIIHGVNCFHVWGSGVAATMKKLYLKAFEQDLLTKRGNKNKLGNYTFWTGKHYYYNQDITIINLYSQYNFGYDKIYADYDAIKKGLEKIEFVFRGSSFSMPRIGAGLAHGDWATIKKIIEDAFIGYQKNEIVRIYYL